MAKKPTDRFEVYFDEKLGTHVLEFKDDKHRTGRYIISDDFILPDENIHPGLIFIEEK